jgi:large subunit ribosomal protein L19
MTNIDIVRKAQNEFLQTGRPDLRTGMEVEVYQIIKENGKERIQRFKGIIIKTAGKNELESTITVRRKVGAFGVEKVFAVHASTIEKIEVLRQFKVRRKSIKFIRDLTGKAARLKEVKMTKEELNAEKALPTVSYPEVKAAKESTHHVETPVETETPESTAEGK